MAALMEYDVLIAGGGLAGASTAISLRQHWPDCRVLMIEKERLEKTVSNQHSQTRPRIGETLPPQCAAVLQQLGLWQGFLALGFLPAHGSLALWQDDELIENPFIFSPFGHGWHIDRQRFDAWVLQAAIDLGIEVHRGARLKTIKQTQTGVQARVQYNEFSQSLSAKYFVDASGRQARYVRQLGAQIEPEDRLIGIAALLLPTSTSNSNSSTLVEAVTDGWWYTASVPDGGQMVIFMTDADIARKQAYKEPAIWSEHLANTRLVKNNLATLMPTTGLNIYAADSHRLRPVADSCWLAVGDAASCFDPLSSLGMLKALRSGVIAAYALKDTAQGDALAMQKYQYVCQQEYQGYLTTRAEYYSLVQRFSDSVFWQRRQELASPQIPSHVAKPWLQPASKLL